jgi:hypothetical protein
MTPTIEDLTTTRITIVKSKSKKHCVIDPNRFYRKSIAPFAYLVPGATHTTTDQQ